MTTPAQAGGERRSLLLTMACSTVFHAAVLLAAFATESPAADLHTAQIPDRFAEVTQALEPPVVEPPRPETAKAIATPEVSPQKPSTTPKAKKTHTRKAPPEPAPDTGSDQSAGPVLLGVRDTAGHTSATHQGALKGLGSGRGSIGGDGQSQGPVKRGGPALIQKGCNDLRQCLGRCGNRADCRNSCHKRCPSIKQALTRVERVGSDALPSTPKRCQLECRNKPQKTQCLTACASKRR